jgi:glycosyltransferase involved in cell wall biosynthesis
MVSVIIPLGNAERTIARTLRSIQGQTVRDIEIIVIDDGSRDRGPEIVRDAMRSDDRIILHSQANAGVAAARNRGLELARADYIAPVDADDLWAPPKLEWQLRTFAGAGAGVGLVYCFFDAIDGDDRVLWPGPRKQVEGPALQALLREDFIGNGSNAMMRRSLLEQVGGYDPGLRKAGGQGGEDWQIGLKLAEISDFACVPDVMVGYRRTRGNMSGDASQMLRSARLVAAPFLERYPEFREVIAAHLEDRRRWLFARAMGDVNLAGMAAIASDAGAKPSVRMAASVAVPVARELAAFAARKAGLRKHVRFLDS